MRDPKRIERILTKVGLLWLKKPDSRLTQLIHNLCADSNIKWRGESQFYFEDKDLEEQVDKEIKTLK